MSERKTRVTVTIDPGLAAYAEQLVAAGQADSVSAVVNSALEAARHRNFRSAELWKQATERANPEKVSRLDAAGRPMVVPVLAVTAGSGRRVGLRHPHAQRGQVAGAPQ